MDSQSSLTMAFRAMVMLSCLILVPVIALFGTTLPETIKRAVQRQLDGNTASAAPSNPVPLAFVPAENTPGVNAPVVAMPGQPAPLPVPTGTAAPIAMVPSESNPGMNYYPSAGPSGVVPAAYIAPAAPMAGAPQAGTIPGTAATGTGGAGFGAAGTDRFTVLKDRLRDLGASYYLLETWGSQGQLFRFYCKVAVGGSPNYARYFEATDADPLRAMSAVLEQVEGWRAGRL
jgi:hypothetical protein